MVGVMGVWLMVVLLSCTYKSGFFKKANVKNRNSGIWKSSFECGFMAHSLKVNSFSSGVFLLLVFFVIFDLEISLLLKSVYQEEFWKSLLYYLLFLVVVGISFLFEALFGFVCWKS